MRSRNVWLTVCSALVLAGCGGGSDNTFTTTRERTTTTPTAPTIRRDVADRLAGSSDEIARRLDAGDTCGAAHAADRLRNELTSAINEGAIPALYLEDLSSSVNELQAQLACSPPAEDDDDHGNGKGKGHDKEKKRKKHDGGDD